MKGIVRIRFARFGRKRAPIYNIVVAKARKPIEVIGTYNPIPTPLSEEQKAQGVKPIKDVELDFMRAKYWLGVGAQPTEPVVKLFKKAGLLGMEWPKPLEVKSKIGEVIKEKEEIVE